MNDYNVSMTNVYVESTDGIVTNGDMTVHTTMFVYASNPSYGAVAITLVYTIDGEIVHREQFLSNQVMLDSHNEFVTTFVSPVANGVYNLMVYVENITPVYEYDVIINEMEHNGMSTIFEVSNASTPMDLTPLPLDVCSLIESHAVEPQGRHNQTNEDVTVVFTIANSIGEDVKTTVDISVNNEKQKEMSVVVPKESSGNEFNTVLRFVNAGDYTIDVEIVKVERVVDPTTT